MGDETPDSMNLDLNLSPGPDPPMTNVPIEMDTWDDGQLRRMREAVRIGARQRSRWRRFHLTPETVSVELNDLMVNSEAGEGSEENKNKSKKKNGSEHGFGKSEDLEDKGEERKNEASEIGFFDCNICLDLSKSPVVTCCGHLFCWPCLYRWLHFHSDAKECPVCKGEVTFKNVTPIYGRGGGTHKSRSGEEEPEGEEGNGSTLKVPDRPQASRVESLRQTIQRNMLSLPMDEMIRRLGSRFDLRGDLFAQNQERDREENNNPLLESAERTNTLLTRILSARGLRREQNPVSAAAAAEEEQNPVSIGEEGRRFHFRRTLNQNHQHGRVSGFPTLSSSFLVEAFRAQPSSQSQHQAGPTGDDRDSFSSIAAVINSESQVDNAAEIDSLVSSSRRRSEAASRASDLDTGDSRAPRRRRFN